MENNAYDTARITSPFSSYRTVSSNLSIGTVSTIGGSLSRMAPISTGDLGIHAHQEELAKALSAILKACDSAFCSAQFLLPNKVKPLNGI